MQVLLKLPSPVFWWDKYVFCLYLFHLEKFSIHLWHLFGEKINQMIGPRHSLVAQPLRDHLAGISLCWNKGGYILLFLCVGIMGLHSPISVAFQEPFMKNLIKCKWWFHQKGTRHWKLSAGNWLFALLTSLPQFCWVGEFIAEPSNPRFQKFWFCFPLLIPPLSHSRLFLWSFSSHWWEQLSL